MTLRWNADDVIDIYASLLRKGEEYKTMDLPTTPTWLHGTLAHADHIRKDGREVGYASGTIYSYHLREVLSMGSSTSMGEIGNDVMVQWGDHGRRIKDVRATVERFPYIAGGSQRRCRYESADRRVELREPAPPQIRRARAVPNRASRTVTGLLER